MYRPSAYEVDDAATLHAFIRDRGFATIAAAIDGIPQFAYAPVILDAEPGARGTVRFHLARANPLAALDGVYIRLSFLGPDAYVSPDWYVTEGLVPTWNYMAVEAAGVACALDAGALPDLLERLSARFESRLAPKVPWTSSKVPRERWAALLNGIVGFEVALDSLAGKFKLSQDKKPADAEAVAAQLDAGGHADLAGAMREHRPHG